MWPLLVDSRSREGVEVAERYADGNATSEELGRAVCGAEQAAREIGRRRRSRKVTLDLHRARQAAAERALEAAGNTGFWASGFARWTLDPRDCKAEREATAPAPMLLLLPRRGRNGLYRCLAHLVRDIFGNPFRSVTFSAAWRTDTAVSLAQHIYECREFSTLPILADALQDAGCDDDQILVHCRSPGPHVRGCWLVDLVLAKE
jgi:hypothetical protein